MSIKIKTSSKKQAHKGSPVDLFNSAVPVRIPTILTTFLGVLFYHLYDTIICGNLISKIKKKQGKVGPKLCEALLVLIGIVFPVNYHVDLNILCPVECSRKATQFMSPSHKNQF